MITKSPLNVWRIRRSEYARLGSLGFFASKRVQLIEGQVIEMSPMGTQHATAVTLCLNAAQRAAPAGTHVRCQLPLVIDEWSEPEPDIAVVRGSPRDFEQSHPTTAELLIEVADASLALDREVKSALYARAGVIEYWIVDLNGRSVEVFREPDPVEGVYRSRRVTREGEVISALCNADAVITADELLPRKK